MRRRSHAKKLLVEGRQEQRVIPELIEANGVLWGESRNEAIVLIDEFDGIENLLKPGVIEAELKSSGVEVVGIIVDADYDLEKRWQAVRNRCLSKFPDLPEKWEETPLIVTADDGLKLGVWIMPDNSKCGMLETFLQYLAPTGSESLVEYAKETCEEAANRGATYTPHQKTKAEIYTWLSWQNEPGRQLHQAVKERILDPSSSSAAGFVEWFRELFEL